MELHPTGKRRRELELWLNSGVVCLFAGRILPVDQDVADLAGRLLAATKKSAHTAELADVLIAATAIVHGLTLATLNRKHFERLGVKLVKF